MAGTTPTILRGLLVPDPRYKVTAYNADDSSVTQAGPMPGVPQAVVDSDMIVEAVGEQVADTTYTISTSTMGHADTDGARFYWSKETPAHNRGWEPPCSISGHEFVGFTTTAGYWADPCVIAHPDGTVIMSSTQGGNLPHIHYRNPDTGTWTAVPGVGDYSPALYQKTCLCLLPSGRVLLFYFGYKTAGFQLLRMDYSDDSGATWTTGSLDCLGGTIDYSVYTINRIRACYLNGQICLLISVEDTSVPEDQIWQYASSSLGATFSEIVQWGGGDRKYIDMCVSANKIHVAYVVDTSAWSTAATYTPIIRSLGSASEDLSSGDYVHGQGSTDSMEWATQSGGIFDSGDLALWADEDGAIYIMGRDHTAGVSYFSDVLIRRSYDQGQTWSHLSEGPLQPKGVPLWAGYDDGTAPVAFSVAAYRGLSLCICTHKSTPATHDDSLSALWLGGYTTVAMPQLSNSTSSPDDICGWTHTWLPYDEPTDVGNIVPVWTASGAGTVSFTSSGMRLQTLSRTYESTDIASTLTEGVLAEGEVKVVSGTAYIDIRISDATPLEYEVRAELTTTTITLYDVKAGAALASASTTLGASGVQVRLSLVGSLPRLYYRAASGRLDRKWATLTYVFTSSAATNNGNRIYFGQPTASETYWSSFHFSDGTHTGASAGFTEGLYGKPGCGRGYAATPVYVDGGLSIQVADGPTYAGDSWTIEPRYQYPIQNIFPDQAPSPRRGWRSNGDGAAEEIIWDLYSKDPTLLQGSLLGLYLGGINFGAAELWGRNAIPNWDKICDLTIAEDLGAFARVDDTIKPKALSDHPGYYYPTNILANSHVKLTGGGGSFYKKVRTNSAGSWNYSSIVANTLAPRIMLEGIDGSEDASGTVELWPREYTLVIPLETEYTAFKLVIPSQSTAEGYYEIGSMVFGHVFPIGGYAVHGGGYGWGRSVEWATNAEIAEGRTGIRTVQSLGPTRRSAEIAWVDGVNTMDLENARPDWIIGWTSGNPVAVPADIPWSLPGLIEQLEGSKSPVVYLPVIDLPATSTTAVEIKDKRHILYSRVVTGSLQADSVVGDEESGEVLRVGKVRLEEEI